jgi:NhaP-type Na+/H+ or K+/H+ antiporter
MMDLAIGLAVGVGAGTVGGVAMRIARRRGWASEDFTGPGVLALALAAYAGTLWLDGNGFVAAFVAGLAFGNSAGRGGVKEVYYVEQTAGLVSLLTWLLFGAVAVPTVLEHADWQVVAYAVLSLTVVRMLPVALALVGSTLPKQTVGFIGWFGPRGLASIIFALIALDELHAEADRAVAVIGMTVLLSVVAHGLSAKPLAARYGAAVARSAPPPEEAPLPQPPVRALHKSHPVAAQTSPPSGEDAG